MPKPKKPVLDVDDEQLIHFPDNYNEHADIQANNDANNGLADVTINNNEEEHSQHQDSESNANIDELMQRIQILEDELHAQKDQYLRTHADAENVKRRAMNEVDSAKKYAPGNIARDLFPIIDNFERAILTIPQDLEESDERYHIKIGLDMVMTMLYDMLTKHNITHVAAINDIFNPNIHQAVQEIEHESIAPGSIVTILQQGYLLHDRLLRPAMVIVAKK